MDAIGELIGTLFSFIFHVLLMIFETLLAIFSPKRRQGLKKQWNESLLLRIEMIACITFLVVTTVAIIYLTLKVSSCSSSNHSTAPHQELAPLTSQPNESDNSTIKIQISNDLKDTLKNKASDYLKEKWKNKQ